MAIRATIKSRMRKDGYDIDIVAELILPHTMTPEQILDTLYWAIKGKPGSQYYDMVERQSRCVTVHYADGMHLDITPTLLIDENDPRLSHLFHAKPKTPASEHKRILMNSSGFCEWFNECTPINISFAKAYGERSKAFNDRIVRADAQVEPVPAHSTVEGGKSTVVIALQLLKRNRNLLHEKREGRMPPSVMMAKIAADTSVPGTSIAGALDAISAALLNVLQTAERNSQLVDVRNPRCTAEKFTDRWPENHAAQRRYIDDLQLFRKQLAALMSDQFMLDQKRDILVAMFGEAPAQSAVDEFAERIGQSVKSGARGIGPTGKVLPLAGIAAPSIIGQAAASQPRGHTFYGSKLKKP